MLPHEYPFRLVERRRGEAVVVSLTVDASWCRGAGAYPAVLALEILAQAAILALPEADAGGRGLLAGIDNARFLAPLEPGDELLARLELAGRFGRLIKVSGTLEDAQGRRLVEAGLLLALDG